MSVTMLLINPGVVSTFIAGVPTFAGRWAMWTSGSSRRQEYGSLKPGHGQGARQGRPAHLCTEFRTDERQ